MTSNCIPLNTQPTTYIMSPFSYLSSDGIYLVNLGNGMPLPAPPQTHIIHVEPNPGWSKGEIIELSAIFATLFCCFINLAWPSAWPKLRRWWRNLRAIRFKLPSCLAWLHQSDSDALLSTFDSASTSSSAASLRSPPLGHWTRMRDGTTHEQEVDTSAVRRSRRWSM